MDKDLGLEIEQEIERSNEAFYSFSDKIITLSTGALTLSIIFRNSLTSNQPPKHLWLLQIAWSGFMMAVLAGTFWSLSKYRVHRDMAGKLRTNGRGSYLTAGPRWYYRFSRKLMMLAFPIAIVALTVFGILNIR